MATEELQVEELEAIPAGVSPYRFDAGNMGHNIGGHESRVKVMFSNFDPTWFIVIDTVTGRRFRITLPRPAEIIESKVEAKPKMSVAEACGDTEYEWGYDPD